jgi:hypothetical protein
MKSFLSTVVDAPKILTPDDGYHYFFGYYDLPATDKQGRHLCHRTAFMDRMQEATDEAELGYVKDGIFTPFAKTRAWNFQQGALLQFHQRKPDTVFYNYEENGSFFTVEKSLVTGEEKRTDRPAAAISDDGKFGLSVNFGRIYDFRPGYGYAGLKDPYSNENAPSEDGVFLIDMETGKSRLLVSYPEIQKIAGFESDKKILVNHINFSRTSNHYAMLVRDFPTNGKRLWTTSLLLGDLEGNIKTVVANTMVSHYRWVNGRDFIMFGSLEGRLSMYIIDMFTGKWRELHTPYFCQEGLADIHCNLLPDGKYIIGDGYPINGYRYLIAYNRETGASKTLFGSKTATPPKEDARCDLHARFSQDGTMITYDTTENGKRQIAAIPMDVLNF